MASSHVHKNLRDIGQVVLKIHVDDLLRVLAGGCFVKPSAGLPAAGLVITGVDTGTAEWGPTFRISVAHADLPPVPMGEMMPTVDLSIEEVPQRPSRGYQFL